MAGNNGLSNLVRYPNVYDNLHDQTCVEVQTFDHDFYLTSFYYGRNDEVYIQEVMDFYIQTNAAAVCIIDEYIDNIPPKVKDLCDEAALPVIFIDSKTPYSLIISSIMEYKLNIERMKLISNKLNSITSNKVSQSEKAELIRDLNPHFANHAVVLFCTQKEPPEKASGDFMGLISQINRNILSFATKYRTGVLVIYTYKEHSAFQVEQAVEQLVETMKDTITGCYIGISNTCATADVGKAITQAFMSVNSGYCDSGQISRYQNLGITRLLVAIEDQPALDEFYHDIASPVFQYDEKNNSNLFSTIEEFMEHDMDYKKTAKAMFVHENTIRYRMHKVRELIQYGKNEIDFFETISIIYKIYKMKSF